MRVVYVDSNPEIKSSEAENLAFEKARNMCNTSRERIVKKHVNGKLAYVLLKKGEHWRDNPTIDEEVGG